jgi:hypothetical protein
MKVTKQFDLIAENEDDILALENFTRPLDFLRCCKDTDLLDELGFRVPCKYPSYVMLGAQNTLLFQPVSKPKKRKAK